MNSRKSMKRSNRKGLFCARQLQAFLLACVLTLTNVFGLAACGNQAQEADADLTGTVSAGDTGATYATMTEKYTALGINSLTSSESVTLLNEFSDAVVDLVNEERAKEDLPAYKTSSLLTEAAMIRAEELATSYSHDRPDETNGYTVLSEVGFTYTMCGENIAMGQVTPACVMKKWMDSATDTANILNQPFVLDDSEEGYTYVNSYEDGFYGYDTIGVGVYYENGVFYWVQLFAKSHTHTWYESKDEEGNVIWSCYDPYYSDPDNGRYLSFNCLAWKDADGVIHDEYNY